MFFFSCQKNIMADGLMSKAAFYSTELAGPVDIWVIWVEKGFFTLVLLGLCRQVLAFKFPCKFGQHLKEKADRSCDSRSGWQMARCERSWSHLPPTVETCRIWKACCHSASQWVACWSVKWCHLLVSLEKIHNKASTYQTVHQKRCRWHVQLR